MKKIFLTVRKKTDVISMVNDYVKDLNKAKKIVEAGAVFLNKKRLLTNQEVNPQETLILYTEKNQLEKMFLNPDYIHYEDTDLIIVYKKQGINCEAVQSSIFNNLAYSVKDYLDKQGIYNYSPSPIGRLDKKARGLILYPKNKKTERFLFDMIKTENLQKEYLAIIPFQLKKELIFCDYINTKGAKSVISDKKEGKKSISRFIPLEFKGQFSLCKVLIETGRKHQIRLHASHHLKPLMGDEVYGSSFLSGRGVALMCKKMIFDYKGKEINAEVKENFVNEFKRDFTDKFLKVE